MVILSQVLTDLVNGWLLFSCNQPDFTGGSGGGTVVGSCRSRQWMVIIFKEKHDYSPRNGGGNVSGSNRSRQWKVTIFM